MRVMAALVLALAAATPAAAQTGSDAHPYAVHMKPGAGEAKGVSRPLQAVEVRQARASTAATSLPKSGPMFLGAWRRSSGK